MLKYRDALVATLVLAALVPPFRATRAQEVRVTPALGLYLPLGRVGGVLIDEPSLGKQQIQTGVLFARVGTHAKNWLNIEGELGYGKGMVVIRDSARTRIVSDIKATIWMADIRGVFRFNPNAGRRLSPYFGLGVGVIGRSGEAWLDTPAKTRPTVLFAFGADAPLGRLAGSPAFRFELSDRVSRAQFDLGLSSQTRARLVHDIIWSWGLSFRIN